MDFNIVHRLSLRLAAAISTGALLACAAASTAQREIVQPLPEASAQASQEQGFRRYLDSVASRARREGVSQRTIDAVLPSLNFDDSVAALDRRFAPTAPGQSFPSFGPEMAKRINAAKIRQGRQVYADEAARLVAIEQKTGVPASVMVAIFGHETNYGTLLGRTDLPTALATLSYEGRRRDLFEGELIAVLKMVDMGVPRSVLRGSYAGAFGYPQFLPSVYLKLAKDGDGDGKAEIWSSRADAFASIANYMVAAGWQRGEPWGFAVSIPSTINPAAIANRENVTKCARAIERHSEWKTLREWKALGVIPRAGTWPGDDRIKASLLITPGLDAQGYLLTRNYRAILDYNCSNYYAMSVGLLADGVRN
ncbi:lytic murein transglycosylase [Blastomonas natatoria]|uniref:Lytic murein transglycosylase n=1 Tax=Blastomonas natatoria TaxID=34015 RepID=A0A2V3V168_9SPHN|nr:lytic murein transglycosylase [Blastomonas natatoria]PXW75280.1 lytic murein transglycosylase [Blastomonas natatoria]